ncbi:acetolactate synthase, small subunit, putative [Entamoeba histolytica HM-1:IMSS-B]|nr:acetolactate synthase, small subunit, putative [Entamoeba histolytica HM-1:IMSS-B]
MGLGAYPGSDRQFLGMLGMHGSYQANLAMHHSDVILAVGARFDDRVINGATRFCPNAKIIHVDIDPASISKTIKADVPIVGPVDSVLAEMVAVVRELSEKPRAENQAAWWKQIEEWRGGREMFPYDKGDGSIIKPQTVIETLYDVTAGDAYITSDVGQHQMFAAQYYRYDKPNRWINSGGLGTMGFGFPAAMGVKLNFPDADVACVTGEGSVQMNIQELSTCMQYDLPVKIVCLNNGALGMQDGADLNMRHIISLLLENEPGALSRVVGLFSQRNYNIESLTVAATEDPTLSRLTLTTIGQEETVEQITKNLNKLIEVVKLVNLSESAHIERELLLIKVKATGAQRAEVKRTTDIFRGQIVDVGSSVYTIQLAGTSEKIDSFIQAIGAASILEVVRSGVTGISRGDKALSI